MHPRYIHLKIHTEYSLCDGLVQIQPLVDKAAEDGMGALAVTDQSNLFAAVKFYQAALQAGIKPILGADIWLANENQPNAPYRLTLLCQSDAGYRNLLKLLSRGFLEGQTLEKAICQRDWLKEANEGLIVLSGAKEGDIGQALLTQQTQALDEACHFWQTYFKDRYYLELRRTGREEEERLIQLSLDLAEKKAFPVVATNDIRFLEKEDFEAHETRVCIHEGFVLADPKRPKHYSEQQYFKTQEDMCELFSDIPEALHNTVEIAKRCTVTLTLGKNFLPRYPVPQGFTTETYLTHAAKEGLEARLSVLFDKESPHFAEIRKPYDARLQTEIDVINKMGFGGYFLIVADFTQWARQNDVPVGPGRGSGPGSLVAYSLNITDLDPLAYDLLFERFLNPERVSMPDFDIDFCMEGRDRVIDYVMQTHGRDCVAQIITYGTMAARAVLRDVGRVLGMSYGHVDKLAKLIPFEIGMTLEKALEQEEVLRERYQQEEDVRTLIDLAKKLEGTTRNVGKHAGGVVIAPEPLTTFTPLYCEPNEAEHLVTQFDKDDVEAVGLVKFDFLGLRTLTIIDWAIKQVNLLRKEKKESPLDIHLIPLDDAATFSMLKECKTTAVFQLESRGMKDLVKRLQPDRFEDIIALVALFRPGPLQSGMVDDFINRKHGRAKVSYPHPELEPILSPTYGVILYQEQVMQIAQVLAGYSLGTADLLRRAMGKKKPEEMAIQREIFCKGAVERGVALDTATHIFDLMEKFAGYGFNKSHSASYALIAYQTAWLKAHYPAAYMASVLSADMDHTDKVVHFIEDAEAIGLHIAPPDINQSEYAFLVVDEKNLRYGLGAIKGVGKAAIDSIVETRKTSGPFRDLFDFCKRVDIKKLNKRLMEALIKAGAFDSIGPHRASIMKSLDLALQNAEQTKSDQVRGQHDLFGHTLQDTSSAVTYLNAAHWSEHERLFSEKETLGLYLSGHPIHRYLNELNHFTSARLNEIHPSLHKNGIVAGIIANVRIIQTKRGDRMAVASLDDNSGQLDILCFPDTFHTYRERLAKDQLIIVEGEISVDDFSGGNRMIARHIYTMDEAREQFAKSLKIHLSHEKSEDLSKIASLLEPFKGGRCRVAIHYSRNDAKANLNLGDAWRVKPSDQLIEKLRSLLQNEKIEVVYE